MANVNNKAFSLLEMSISLTITAMIIATVLAGQSIKHRAELSQIISDIGTITSAVIQFKGGYYQGTTYTGAYPGTYPGDLSTAQASLGSTTTNGDGNSYLATALVGTPTVFDQRNTTEELFFWQHLQLAGLITGTYDGATVGTGGLMASSIKYGFYQARKAMNFPNAGDNSTGRLIIQVSKADGSGLFSTKEAYDFDVKYDNGNPGFSDPVTTTGTISAADGTGAAAGDCVTTSTSPDQYKLSNTYGTPCVLYFYIE